MQEDAIKEMKAYRQKLINKNEKNQEVKSVPKEKTILTKLDYYLTPAPKFDPEDPEQLNARKKLKRAQLREMMKKDPKSLEDDKKGIQEIMPSKATEDQILRAFLAKKDNRIGVEAFGDKVGETVGQISQDVKNIFECIKPEEQLDSYQNTEHR